jgi:hypothetical protein
MVGIAGGQITDWDAAWWVRDWEKSLEKPEKILFARSIRNMSQYLAGEFPKSANPHDLNLLAYLKGRLARKNLESRLLSKCDKNVLPNLTALLSIQKSDLKQIAAGLVNLTNIYQSDAYLLALHKEFIRNIKRPTKASAANISNVTGLLVRGLLDRFSPEYLKGLASSSFLGSLFQYHKGAFVNALTNDAQLFSLLPIVGQNVI